MSEIGPIGPAPIRPPVRITRVASRQPREQEQPGHEEEPSEDPPEEQPPPDDRPEPQHVDIRG